MSLSRQPWNTGSCGRKQPDKGRAHRVVPLTWPHLPSGTREHASHACLCLHHISGNRWGVLRRLAGLCAGLRTTAREIYEHLRASSSVPLPSVCVLRAPHSPQAFLWEGASPAGDPGAPPTLLRGSQRTTAPAWGLRQSRSLAHSQK